MTTKEITRIALFVAIAATSAVIVRFGGEPVVPFSLLPLVAILAGSLLGPKLGSLSMIIYMILGLIGLPIFASPPYGGPAYLFKPTFGFLIGFIAAAFISGLIIRIGREPNLIKYLFAMILGILIIYLIGIPYLFFILNHVTGKTISWLGVLQVGFLPFILFDLVKAFIGAFLVQVLNVRLRYLGFVE